ncbi:AAA family ATPase [Maribacter arenosus]|uniref:AAA family ATPase n=1 Tax=Maribacter arenosus TaxID=1854708 RepID=A0ABR7VHD1_9FLAO|nr:AAA family ATPase [Maribacter arenosus]MBD0851952.1 AAA family ATPase [Maribacter arenosus]
MKIKSIEIENYKSIESIVFPILSYGTGTNKSSTAVLVGVNESGKSNILEAIGYIATGFEEQDYSLICRKEAQENKEYVELWVRLEIENQKPYQDILLKEQPKLKSIIDKIKITDLTKNIYCGPEEDVATSISTLRLEDIPELHRFVVIEVNETINGKATKTKNIDLLTLEKTPKSKMSINTAKTLLKEGQKLLDKKLLETICSTTLEASINSKIPQIVFWKASEKYLINESIELTEFSTNPSSSIPLKNMFHIYGKKTQPEISECITLALGSPSKKAELVDSLSSVITKHVNRIWKEHKINVKVSIDGSKCQVHIEDKKVKYKYFTMNQRSDGFKQFVSLILSLSVETTNNSLKNQIILLDEPEVHLHPSGIRFMRDELLKIGKQNNVIIATHSHYMVDATTVDRHWVVQKDENTSIEQIDDSRTMVDEEVLSKAFGIDLMRELIPNNVFLVEGTGDKNLINHLFKLDKTNPSYTIKSAGGASKVYSIASLLAEEKILATIILDDDLEGRKIKKEIISKVKNPFSENNVLTLRDVLGGLPAYSTLEDLYPISYLSEVFKSEFGKELKLANGKPILSLIVSQEETLKGKNNKEKLDKFKTKITEGFIKKYRTFKSLEKECTLLINFSIKLKEKLNEI